MYKSEKIFLKISSSNVYEKMDTACIQNGYKSDTQVRVGKDRMGYFEVEFFDLKIRGRFRW